MQIVERGLIGLDDDVGPYVPDLAALEVLDGGETADGVPTTKPRKNKITLRYVSYHSTLTTKKDQPTKKLYGFRLLLSHQSGVGYDLMPLSLAKWAKASGLKYTTLDNTGVMF